MDRFSLFLASSGVVSPVPMLDAKEARIFFLPEGYHLRYDRVSLWIEDDAGTVWDVEAAPGAYADGFPHARLIHSAGVMYGPDLVRVDG